MTYCRLSLDSWGSRHPAIYYGYLSFQPLPCTYEYLCSVLISLIQYAGHLQSTSHASLDTATTSAMAPLLEFETRRRQGSLRTHCVPHDPLVW